MTSRALSLTDVPMIASSPSVPWLQTSSMREGPPSPTAALAHADYERLRDSILRRLQGEGSSYDERALEAVCRSLTFGDTNRSTPRKMLPPYLFPFAVNAAEQKSFPGILAALSIRDPNDASLADVANTIRRSIGLEEDEVRRVIEDIEEALVDALDANFNTFVAEKNLWW